MTVCPAKVTLRQEMRTFLGLAIPLAFAQVAQASTGLVDTVMMGWLGATTLASGGLASMTFFALLATAMGGVAGVSPLVAEALGAGRPKAVGILIRQGLWLTLLIALPTSLILSRSELVLPHLGQAPTTVALAKQYLDVLAWGFAPGLGFAVLRGAMASLADTGPVMAIVLGATLFNILGNYVLGFGHWGFPRLELTGLALASLIAQWGMFLSLAIYMAGRPAFQPYRIFRGLHRLDLPRLGDLVNLGIPIGLSSALEIGLFLVVSYLMGILGVAVLAAHQIVFQSLFVIFMVPLGMSFAATARVGFWLGQGDLSAARQAGRVAMGLGMGFMTATAILLLAFPRALVGFFLDLSRPESQEVLRLALPILVVAALSQVLDGVQKTASGALLGLKDTRVPVLLSFVAFWGIGLASGVALGFPLQWGGTGLWLGQSLGVAVSAGLFVWRFHHLTGPRYP